MYINRSTISPEDKADSEILRQVYRKILKRSNAKLTPEEENIIQKYNLRRVNKNLTDKNYNPLFTSDISFDKKINLADRARKLGKRNYAKEIDDMSRYYHGNTFQDRERSKVNIDMSKNINDMINILADRNYYQKALDNVDTRYDNEAEELKAKIEKLKKRLDSIESNRQFSKDYNQIQIDKIEDRINKLLKRDR